MVGRSSALCHNKEESCAEKRTADETARPCGVVVDVIEEPAPGVITVTEFEETQIPAGRDEREEC
jgi:hypothetical protein